MRREQEIVKVKDINTKKRDNEIEELILPKGLRYLSCENNKIKKLKLSPYIEELYCDDEYINYENIPNMIKILEIETKENEIKSKLPYGLEEIKGGCPNT